MTGTGSPLPTSTLVTVMDLVIEPGDTRVDRGWMRRNLALPTGATRPAIERDEGGAWFLRFDGTDDEISQPAFAPPGISTATSAASGYSNAVSPPRRSRPAMARRWPGHDDN